MKRLMIVLSIGLLALGLATTALAQAPNARVRVVHASPDAPAVDILVNDGVVFSNVAFKQATSYASVPAATYNVKVAPAGATTPVVIEADLTLTAEAGGYTVVAVGKLANIEPVVLVDSATTPMAGTAHVRFVHASPDAPAVDIKVKDGPVLFSDVAFKESGDYVSVAAGTYDLEVRLPGTNDLVLSVPGVALADQTVYTVFAMGLAGGTPSLMAVPVVDAAAAAAAPAPLLPESGAESGLYAIAGIALGLALILGSLALRLHLARK